MTTVTVIPGDGIGPEIMDAALLVLRSCGVPLAFEAVLAGAAAERIDGHPLQPAAVEAIQRNRVAIKGPLIVERGSPPVDLGSGERYATPNAALRGVCQAFANVRPCRRFDGVPTRYNDTPIDFIIVREVSEGIYVGRERRIDAGHAEATLVTTRAASERISRFAFAWARAHRRKAVTAVHKANVLDQTDGLFLDSFRTAAAEFPEIAASDCMIDAAAAQMVLDPGAFDVIVAPNQYGDILSDLGAALVGGLGLGPGGNYGPEIALFEACHGAAPGIAGQNRANPVALILSGAMLLDHIGEETAAQAVRRAVERFLASGAGLTPDLGGCGTTRGAAEAIVQHIETRQ